MPGPGVTEEREGVTKGTVTRGLLGTSLGALLGVTSGVTKEQRRY